MFSWTVHKKGSPKADRGAAVAVRHELYYFGGTRDEHNEDQIGVHVFNTVSLEWKKLPPVTPGRGERTPEVPSSSAGHTAVLIEDIVYIWGGSHYYNVLYAFDVDAHRWFKPRVSGSVPEGRYNHSACVLGKVMFIHGGYIQLKPTGLTCTNDMYKLDTTTMVWSVVNTRGTASHYNSATIIGTEMFVFGGWGYEGCYNTIRVFDTETNCWLASTYLPEVPPDYSAFFTYNGEPYIFGGRTRSLLWKFSPESLSWKKVRSKRKRPPPTYRMCCCMVGDRIFLFGGEKTPDGLYVLDLSPSLKTLCKVMVILCGLEQSGLPHNIRWELAAMTTNN